jgi:hypothetical protein
LKKNEGTAGFPRQVGQLGPNVHFNASDIFHLRFEFVVVLDLIVSREDDLKNNLPSSQLSAAGSMHTCGGEGIASAGYRRLRRSLLGGAQINSCPALRALHFYSRPLWQTSLPATGNKNAPLLSGAGHEIDLWR